MSASKKLSTAVRALCYLAESYPEPKNSTEIADYTGINASKLRKILSYLVKNKIVESSKGTSGGFILAKDPEQVDLQEVYCAIEDRKAFHLDVTTTENANNAETRFNDYFLGLFSEIQVDIESKMKNITLESINSKLNIKSSFSINNHT